VSKCLSVDKVLLCAPDRAGSAAGSSASERCPGVGQFECAVTPSLGIYPS
jgi:hypothetical protein